MEREGGHKFEGGMGNAKARIDLSRTFGLTEGLVPDLGTKVLVMESSQFMGTIGCAYRMMGFPS